MDQGDRERIYVGIKLSDAYEAERQDSPEEKGKTLLMFIDNETAPKAGHEGARGKRSKVSEKKPGAQEGVRPEEHPQAG